MGRLQQLNKENLTIENKNGTPITDNYEAIDKPKIHYIRFRCNEKLSTK